MLAPAIINVPIRTDESGTIRVSGTRVSLDVVLACYRQGYTPEQIHDSFSVVPLNDVYALLAYYLANQVEIDAYLVQQDEKAAVIRAEIEARYTPEQRAARQRVLDKLAELRRAEGE